MLIEQALSGGQGGLIRFAQALALFTNRNPNNVKKRQG
jgi:hypothetical protein